MKRRCPICNGPVLGRSDKRFCSNQCRTHHHNLLLRDEYAPVKRINKILRKNRTVLMKYHQSNALKVLSNKMKYDGIDFSFFTHIKSDAKNHPIIFCYDYGYQMINHDEYQILHLNSIHHRTKVTSPV